MKGNRHTAILDIITKYAVDTQDGLTERLRERGFEVTQATVSRDIRQLGLVKTRGSDGKSRYTPPGTLGKNFVGRLSNILRESVNHVDSAENIVVVKTLAGVASAAAAAIDSMEHTSIVGTLAGDDTILIVMRSKGSAETFRKEIETLL